VNHVSDGIMIHVNSAKGMKYRIVDVTGNICVTGDIETNPFKLPVMTKGLYLLQIIATDAMQVVPFIN
jgi:hypothetical protein